MNLVELCQKAISIDSSESHGTSDSADFFAEVAWKLGLFVELIDDVHQGQPQKILIVRPNGDRAIKDFLLTAQIETRDPNAYSGWTKTGANPFNASIDGDLLYGLGASETKLDFVCKLLAMSTFAPQRFNKIGPVLVGGFGGPTGISIMKLLRRRIVDPKFALVGEATQLQVAERGPGYAEIEIFVPYSDEEKQHLAKMQFLENVTTQNKCFTADKALTEDRDFSENPISELLTYLKNLPDGMVLVSADGGQSSKTHPDAAWLEIELFDGLRDTVIPKLVKLYEVLQNLASEFRSVRDSSFIPAYSKINLGRIQTRPDGISITGSCNFVPQVTKEHYEKWLGQLKNECEKLGSHFQLLDFREPFRGHPNGELAKHLLTVLEASGRNLNMTVARRGSDANLLARFKIETLVFGPGRAVDSQLTNEHISITELEASTAIYRDLIKRTCE